MDQQREAERGEGELRERLRGLEERVAELEHAARQAQRQRRRSRLLFLLGLAVYVLMLTWELNQIL